MANDEPVVSLPWWPSSDARQAAAAGRRRARRNEPAAGRPGQPRGKTSLDEIVEAALQIVDTEGADALTIRRLANELGVGAMTVYSYVRDKDELLDLVVDQAIAEVRLPRAEGDWRDRARNLAHNLRATLLAHPAGIRLASERPMRGPHAFRLLEAGLGIFRDAGFSDERAAYAHLALGNYVLGSVLAESSAIGRQLQPADVPGEPADVSASGVRQLSVEQFPNVIALAEYLYPAAVGSSHVEHSGVTEPDGPFGFGLERLLDGFAAIAPEREAQTREPAAGSSDHR